MKPQVFKNVTMLVILFCVFPLGLNAVQVDQPDLTTKIRCPNQAYPGQKLGKTIQVMIANKGNATASNSFVDIVLSTDRTVPVKLAQYSPSFKEDVLLKGGRETVRSISPGANFINLSFAGTLRIPFNTKPGRYYIGSVIDSDKKIRESNEENNTDICRIEIIPIDSLTKTQQLNIYIEALKEGSLPHPDCLNFIRKFARLAIDLSPYYGNSTVPIEEELWISFLREGWSSDKYDQDIVFALTQLLINQKKYRQALIFIEPFHKRNRENHLASAWHEWAKSGGPQFSDMVAFDRYAFDIYFCTITKNPKAHRIATLNQLRKEIDILNEGFRTLYGKGIVRFRFKDASFYNEVKDSRNCQFVSLGDSKAPYNSDRYAELFNECNDPKVRDPHAINFFIYDSYSSEDGYNDGTCHGKRNSNRPYILIDWERMVTREQNPTIHEMGHAFGLGHVGVIGATFNDKTNIMGSKACGFGSGGNRKLGFTEAQQAIIYYHAQRTRDRLK